MAPIRVQILEVLPAHEPGRTSNIEHPTPNIEWQREFSLTSAFGVRCWMFDVSPRFRGFDARIFISRNSTHEPPPHPVPLHPPGGRGAPHVRAGLGPGRRPGP